MVSVQSSIYIGLNYATMNFSEGKQIPGVILGSRLSQKQRLVFTPHTTTSTVCTDKISSQGTLDGAYDYDDTPTRHGSTMGQRALVPLFPHPSSSLHHERTLSRELSHA